MRISLSRIVLLLWMLFIFIMSAQTGERSGDMSAGLLSWFYSYLEKFSWGIDYETIHHLLRKGAHFTAYMILGILGYWDSKTKRIIPIIGFCALYAVSDEIHQAFVPNRGPSVWDVMIDTTGAAFGLILIYSFKWFRKQKV